MKSGASKNDKRKLKLPSRNVSPDQSNSKECKSDDEPPDMPEWWHVRIEKVQAWLDRNFPSTESSISADSDDDASSSYSADAEDSSSSSLDLCASDYNTASSSGGEEPLGEDSDEETSLSPRQSRITTSATKKTRCDLRPQSRFIDRADILPVMDQDGKPKVIGEGGYGKLYLRRYKGKLVVEKNLTNKRGKIIANHLYL